MHKRLILLCLQSIEVVSSPTTNDFFFSWIVVRKVSIRKFDLLNKIKFSRTRFFGRVNKVFGGKPFDEADFAW
jgi:hypothetical protein